MSYTLYNISCIIMLYIYVIYTLYERTGDEPLEPLKEPHNVRMIELPQDVHLILHLLLGHLTPLLGDALRHLATSRLAPFDILH